LLVQANRKCEIVEPEFQYIMNLSYEEFSQHVDKGYIPIFPLKLANEQNSTPKNAVYYSKMEWMYKNRHLLESMPQEEFIKCAEERDFIFKTNSSTIDLDNYIKTIYHLSEIRKPKYRLFCAFKL